MSWDFVHQIKAWLLANPLVVAIGLAVLVGLVGIASQHLLMLAINFVVPKSKAELHTEMQKLLHRPLQAVAFLGAALLAVEWFVDEELRFRSNLTRILLTFLTAALVIGLIRTLRLFFHNAMSRMKGRSNWSHLLPLFDNLIVVVVIIWAGYWLLDLWNINVTPLLASAGIATAAVALASKDTLANLFGGVSVMVDRPYRVGDYIDLDKGERGEVLSIGLRSTRIRTRDDVLISVPNALIANRVIVNESGAAPRLRVRAKVGVGYASDPDQVEAALMSCAEGLNDVLDFPKPRVRFRSFGDSTLDFELLCWIRFPADRGRVLHLLNRAIYYKLKEEGIEIPFPQRVLHWPADQPSPGPRGELAQDPAPPPAAE
ncbi:MAG: mechanosensitive ion channel family protein [Deltaproteobacteria bacterium]|nr:mechanosensitive ion channel family protein [Deltaproteobacteria bacterium]